MERIYQNSELSDICRGITEKDDYGIHLNKIKDITDTLG